MQIISPSRGENEATHYIVGELKPVTDRVTPHSLLAIILCLYTFKKPYALFGTVVEMKLPNTYLL